MYYSPCSDFDSTVTDYINSVQSQLPQLISCVEILYLSRHSSGNTLPHPRTDVFPHPSFVSVLELMYFFSFANMSVISKSSAPSPYMIYQSISPYLLQYLFACIFMHLGVFLQIILVQRFRSSLLGSSILF